MVWGIFYTRLSSHDRIISCISISLVSVSLLRGPLSVHHHNIDHNRSPPQHQPLPVVMEFSRHWQTGCQEFSTFLVSADEFYSNRKVNSFQSGSSTEKYLNIYLISSRSLTECALKWIFVREEKCLWNTYDRLNYVYHVTRFYTQSCYLLRSHFMS